MNQNNSSPVVELEAVRALLNARQTEAMEALAQAIGNVDSLRAQVHLERSIMLAELSRLFKRFRGEGGEGTLTYAVSTLFLRDCYRVLVADSDEYLHYVTGIRLGSLLTLDRIVEIELDVASSVSAVGNLASSHAALVELDRAGHMLHGLFHRHPGRGAGATRPSPTDLGTHERLERGGYPCVGAIFTEDGYLRFFSAGIHFDVIPYGEGVEQVEDSTYCLSQISDLSNERT